MSIPFYNFQQLHHQDFRAEILETFKQIIEQGSFVEGPYNQKFETEFALMQKAGFCRLVANGTDAIEMALKVLDVKPGDLVAVPGITFFATAEAVLNVGAKVIHVDVDPNTGLMDPLSLERIAKNFNLKAAIPVHIYGLPADISAINSLGKKHNFAVIEDAAQAQGAFLPEGPVGCSGNLTTFSFYPTKNLSAFGDAGAILGTDSSQIKAIEAERNHGRGVENSYGRNSRCDHLQAAVLWTKLREIEKLNQQRKQIAEIYHESLHSLPIKLVPEKYLKTSSWHLYPIYLESRKEKDLLREHLGRFEITTSPFYEKAISQDRPVIDQPGEKKVAEQLAGTVVCIPLHPFLRRDEIEFVSEKIKAFFS